MWELACGNYETFSKRLPPPKAVVQLTINKLPHPSSLPKPDPRTTDHQCNYLSKTQKERHPARASSTLTLGTKGFLKVKVLERAFPLVGLVLSDPG